MKITLNTKTPIIYDFLRVIMFKYNNIDFIGQLGESGYTVNDRVRKAISFVWEDLDVNVPGVALFFKYTKENRCYMFNKLDRVIHDLNDINELIEKAFEGSVEELQISLLEYFDDEKREVSYYRNLFEDDADLFTFINSMEIPVICRWELYGIIRKPEEILEPLKLFCHRVKRKLKNVYKENSEAIKSFNKEMSVKIKNKQEYFLDGELRCLFDRDMKSNNQEIFLTYSLIDEVRALLYTSNNKNYILLGMNYKKIINTADDSDSKYINDAFLKAFSDKHRMVIFRLLLNKEMYVGQIAKETGAILSTTSYHLDIMLGAGILSGRSQGKKTFYTVNTKFVTNRFNEISDLVKSRTY